MLFKYGPGVYLTLNFFSRLLMVQEHMVLECNGPGAYGPGE